MDLEQAIYTRRAVRAFSEDPVDEAIQAPSAVNQQPWLFSVVRDRALLVHVSEQAKAFMMKTSPAALVSHHFDALLADPDFDIFYKAPALILISVASPTPWQTEDCALAAQNLMLAARGAGLGTCWIGFAQGWLGTPEGKAALRLPASSVPIAPIIVGHPKSEPPPVPRNPPQIDWIGT